MSQFSVRLTMLSDWHIGCGTGRHGSIDKLLDRDRDGFPYIPASSLRGIWRDASERLALGLDDGTENGNWAGLVNLIFGSQPNLSKKGDEKTKPVAGCVSFGDLRFPPGFRNRLKSASNLKDALAFVKPGVKIEKKSGRAKDDHLRFEEMGRVGAVFSVDGLFLPGEGFPEDLVEPARALLVAAAKLVERIGGKRRRGAGRCRLEVTMPDMDGQRAISVLEQTKSIELPKRDTSPQQANLDYCADRTGSEWLEFQFSAETKSPVIIADQVMGNVVTTLDHVPGFYLLKHVASALGKQQFDPWPDIAAGNIQVLPLYPLIDGNRALPIPLCWECEKSAARNDIQQVLNRLLNEDESSSQKKPYRAGYVTRSQDKTRWLPSVPKTLRTHNVIDDGVQRPTEQVGGVFTYEAIAAGQTFAGRIRIRKDIDINIDEFCRELAGEAAVGRARRVGYGRLALGPARIMSAPTCSTSDNAILVSLTSDLLLEGADLSGTTTADGLADAIETAIDEPGLFDRKKIEAEIRTRRLESWQASWGLPRPTLVALQAGSVIHLPFMAGKQADKAKLARLMQDGLGQRRGEGFGQIRINDPLVTTKSFSMEKIRHADTPDEKKDTIEIEPEMEEFTRLIETVACQREITQAAETLGANKHKRQEILGWTTDKPNNSQLGVLRSLLGQVVELDHLSDIREWLEKLKGNDKSTKWGGAKNIDKLLGLLANNGIWNHLNAPKNSNSALELFAVRTFLLRAMHHHRRAAEGTSQEQVA